MVPSDRSKEVRHTSGGEGSDSSLAGKISGDALSQLENMFKDQEVENAEVAPEVAGETEATKKSKAQLGGVALGAEVPEPEVASRTPRTASARRTHEEILKLSRELTEQRQAAVAGSVKESADQPVEEPTPSPKPIDKTPEETPPVVEAEVEVAVPEPEKDTDEAPQPFDKKKQEELWGVHDKIAPEDVPEGELTWEQYIANRKAAEEGDVMHSTDKNGRTIVYDALTGHRVKEQDYMNQFERSSVQEHHDQAMVDKDHADALEENERRTEGVNDILRTNAEGEVAVKKSDQLRGLALIGQELLALRDSTTNRELFTPELQKELASKEATFKDLYELYGDKGLDAAGLQFINDTYMEPYDDVKVKPYKGSAWHDNEKVALEDVITSPGGDKAYVVAGENGESRTVHAKEVTFKQEFEVPEPEKEPEEKGIKKWWNKVRAGFYKLGGAAFWAQEWARGARSSILEYGIDDSLSDEEKERKRKRNRVAASITGGAIAVALIGGAWALGSNIVDEVNSASSGGGSPNPDTAGWLGFEQENIDAFDSPTSVGFAVDSGAVGGESIDHSGPRILPVEGSPDVEVLEPTSAYPEVTVQSGDGGEVLLSRYGIDSAKWYDIAERLYNEFPSHFYKEGTDVRLMGAGPLPQGAQDIINSLR